MLATNMRNAVERKQYPGYRGTVSNIVRDSDVMSNKIFTIAVPAPNRGLCQKDSTLHTIITENQKLVATLQTGSTEAQETKAADQGCSPPVEILSDRLAHWT